MATDWLLVVLTLVIAVLTYFVWKVYERIAWLTGAMESHSDLMLRIEALRGINNTPIELVWWDPTLGEIPTIKEHGAPVDMSKIYVYLPPKLRKNKPSTGDRLRRLFQLPEA